MGNNFDTGEGDDDEAIDFGAVEGVKGASTSQVDGACHPLDQTDACRVRDVGYAHRTRRL